MSKPYGPLILLGVLRLTNGLNFLAAGATGAFGRQFAKSSIDGGDSVMVLSRNGFLASAPSRVSHDYGYLGPKLTRLNNLVVRDWHGGDMLDITGDTWVDWQFSVAEFNPDVAVCLTGCLSEARVLAVKSLVEAVQGMSAADRPKRFVLVGPCDAVVRVPAVRDRLHRCEVIASDGLRGIGVEFVSVRLGRVMGLKGVVPSVDSTESSVLDLYFNSPARTKLYSGEQVPWVHVSDALNAIRVACLCPLTSTTDQQLIVDAEKPVDSDLAAAGFSFEVQSIKESGAVGVI